MKAENLKISKVFSSGGDIHYVLPHFQREYTWDKEHWETLLKDAFSVYEETNESQVHEIGDFEHFLGSIVVIPDGTRRGTMGAFKLVDGQQRLTTITLLLRALADCVVEAHQTLFRKIEKHILNVDEKDDLYFKLLPTAKHGDRIAYTAIMCGENPPPTDSKITKAFSYFRTEIQNALNGGYDAEKLFSVIAQSFQLVFIELHANESPYKIFESLNAKGKPLSQADLVRNYIAMRLPAPEQERIFTESWSKVESLLHDSRLVGRLGELTAFLRHYLALQLGVLVEEEHVYARFRDRAENQFKTVLEFENELKNLSQYAIHYDRLLRPKNHSSPLVSDRLSRLNRLESSTAYPFLMELLTQEQTAHISSADVVEGLQILENYMVRRYLKGEPTSSLNKVFPSLWGRIDKKNLALSLREILASKNCPSDAQILRSVEKRKLYSTDPSTRARTILILETINKQLSAGTGGFTSLDGNATIEHIMPQTLSKYWQSDLGLLSEQIHKDYLHTLGNLTLITGEWNSELSNSRFSEKKLRFAKHALKLNSAYFSQEFARWGRDEIKERTERLAETAIGIWPSLGEDNSEEDPPREAMEFHFEALERIAEKLATRFLRLGPARFESEKDNTRLVGLCSKRHRASGKMEKSYWFGFKPTQREFLTWPGDSFVALELEIPAKTLLFKFSEFEPLLREVVFSEGRHWHLILFEKDESIFLRLPHSKEERDVTNALLGPVS